MIRQGLPQAFYLAVVTTAAPFPASLPERLEAGPGMRARAS